MVARTEELVLWTEVLGGKLIKTELGRQKNRCNQVERYFRTWLKPRDTRIREVH